jgi:hypothetical protein
MVEAGYLRMMDAVGHDKATVRAGLGERLPFSPPYGTLPMAYRGHDEIDRWLTTSPTPLDEQSRRRYHHVIEGIRQHGYAVSRNIELEATSVQLHQLLALLEDTSGAELVRSKLAELMSPFSGGIYLPTELQDAGPISVSYIVAGIFGPDARPRYQLQVEVLETALATTELRQLIARVMATSRRLTKHIGGTTPA